MSSEGAAAPPLVAHIIHRLDFGGLENGLVNLINAMPVERYRHAIVCLTDYSRFRERVRRPDVAVYALHKRPGKDFGLYGRLWRLLRRVRPDIVHTRNLAAVDCLVPAALAGVPHRVHGEHGRDVVDLDGRNWKYVWLRRLTRPLVDRYIPLSEDLEAWLHERIGVPPQRLRRIYNGVDSRRFHPVTPAGGAHLPVDRLRGAGQHRSSARSGACSR
jgi:sugar transferase (PEP-CTERM/EpsH1 system associated)